MSAFDKESKELNITVIDDITEEMMQAEPPVVSIYLPILHNNKTGMDSKWDDSLLTELCQSAEKELAGDWAELNSKAAAAVAENIAFLKQYGHSSGELGLLMNREEHRFAESIGLFITQDKFYATILDVNVPEGIAQVSYDFFVKPLIRNKAHRRSFYVMSISSDRSVLAQGDQNHLFKPTVPFTGNEFYAEDRPVQYEIADDEKSALDYYSLDGHHSPYEGRKSRNDVKKEDFDKFVRLLVKQLDDYLRDNTQLVVICCAREHENLIRDVVSKMARKEFVCDTYILQDSRGLSSEELHDKACAIVTSRVHERDCETLNEFSTLLHQGMASDDLVQIGKAIYEGRVKSIFVARGRGIAGEFNRINGEITLAMQPVEIGTGIPAAADNDISNDLVLAALKQGADIKVLAQDDMPTDAAIVAVMRWAS